MTRFDGIRRVAVVLSCIAAMAAAEAIWNEKPPVDLIYQIDGVIGRNITYSDAVQK